MDFQTSYHAKATLTDPTGRTFDLDLTKAFHAPDEEADPDGIYRSEDNVMNAYLQTYTTGSSILIFTPNLGHWFVFLESDWKAGFNDSDDLGGEGLNLNMFDEDDCSYKAIIGDSTGNLSEFSMHLVYDSK
jgi:hypothetical protein